MRETPYKHKKNGHCRSPIARGKIFEVAFGVEHLSTAIQWALGNRLCRPPPLARRCTEHFQWTQRDPRTVRGSWRGSPALPRWGDGAGAAAMPGDAAGWQQGFPSASPHPSQGSPKQGTTRVWQKTQSVFETDINSSLSNNLFAFPAPPPQEALDCAQDYNIVELLQRLHLITKSDGLLQGISYFHINSTGQKKKK